MTYSIQEVPNLDLFEEDSMYDLTFQQILQEVPQALDVHQNPDIKLEDDFNFGCYTATTTQHVPMIGDFNTYSPLQAVSSVPSPSMPYSAPITFSQTNSPYQQQHGYANSPASGSSYSGSPMESPQQLYHSNEDYLRYGLTQALNARHQQEYAYYYGDYNMKRRKRDEELTHEEYQKRRLRRERNKEAALRCRTRRRERIDALEQETAEIEQDNNKVENEISKLQQQVNEMQKLLKEHKCDKTLADESQMKAEESF